MESDSPSPRQERAHFLPLFLALLFGGGFLTFLILISGGYFLALVIVVSIGIMMAFFHYLLWGRDMMARTIGEREEEQLRAESFRARNASDE